MPKRSRSLGLLSLRTCPRSPWPPPCEKPLPTIAETVAGRQKLPVYFQLYADAKLGKPGWRSTKP